MGTVRVTISRQESDFHFQAKNEAGLSVDMDNASSHEDGIGNGASPMQLVLVALGGCSGIDVVSILKKGRQEIRRFAMEVVGEKPDNVAPSVYSDVFVHYVLEGDLDPVRVRRAIELSQEKYCSVAAMLNQSVNIRYDFELNGEQFAESTG